MPTVVGSIFGSARLGVGMAMVVWAWTLPYLLVRALSPRSGSPTHASRLFCFFQGSPIAGYLVEAVSLSALAAACCPCDTDRSPSLAVRRH
jgi:hypothetical protein